MKKKTKAEKQLADLRAKSELLVNAANRAQFKFGCDQYSRIPSDFSEWVELRLRIREVAALL